MSPVQFSGALVEFPASHRSVNVIEQSVVFAPRFIRKDEKTGLWYDIGDKRAAEKTSQALREKTNEERDQPKSATPFTSPTVFLPTLAEAAGATVAAVNAEGKEEEPIREESGETDADKADSDDKKKNETENSEKPKGDETETNGDDGTKEENYVDTKDSETAAAKKEGDEKKIDDDTQTVEV
jgi:hypothetical protein